MAEPKYVIATIKLPIEMLADGTFKTHADRADIGFLPCSSLPTINTELNSSAFYKLQELIGLEISGDDSPRSLKKTQETIELNDTPLFVFKRIDEMGECSVEVEKELLSSSERLNSVAFGTEAKELRSIAVTDTEPVAFGSEAKVSGVTDTVSPTLRPVDEPLETTETNAIINEVLKLFIKKGEINQTTKRSLSTTFKTYPKSNHNFSSKKRS
jgi:hypothetical protein